MDDDNHQSPPAALPAYPTGSTVPFPYDSPYPQQVGLMDALLQSLQMREQAERRDEGNDRAAGGGVAGTSSSRAKKRRATIIMLESPTGTGKSLSLACSSVAWLRYREQLDLLSKEAANNGINNPAASAVADTPDIKTTVAPASSASTHTTGVDWIDSFQSPEQRAEQDRIELEEQCRRRAVKARTELHRELTTIRDRLDRAAAISLSLSSAGNNSNIAKAAQERVRAVRENLARSAATAAAVVERRQRRRKGQCRKVGGVGSVFKRSRTDASSSSNKQKDEQDADYCVEEYNSDDNYGASTDGFNDDDDDDDSSDDEKGNYKHSKGKENWKGSGQTMQQEQELLPSELLSGGKLDGSNYDPNSQYKESADSSSSSQLLPTVGSVQPGSGVRKIVYAARTHSQLSQFVGELRRTAWGADLRVVALGGRKLLCGNRDVMGPKYRSEKIITERCLDLQKGKKSSSSNATNTSSKVGEKRKKIVSTAKSAAASTSGCPLLSSREAVSSLAVHLLARPSDIEDIGSLGQASHVCAYYASRGSLTAAEVVVVPYNTLLSTQARSAVGLSLHNSLVIIDEAHNVPEALRSLSSSRLTLPVIKAATEQLAAYTKRYASRLAGRNLFYLGQIRRCLTAMTRYLSKNQSFTVGTSSSSSNVSSKMMSGTELLFALKLDNLNLFKILRYLEKSRLSQKLLGFTNHAANDHRQRSTEEEGGDDPDFVSKHVSSLSIVQTFLSCLTGSHREGKVVVEWPDRDASVDLRGRGALRHPTFRYVLLNPAAHFTDVLDESYAVILAGGTLRPFSHVAAELVASHDADIIVAASKAEASAASSNDKTICTISTEISTFTCDHVVSSSHVHMARLAVGPTSTKLDFRHASRTSDAVCDELGRSLLNLASVVPAGLVVFLPSYSYEAHLMRRWGQTKVLDQVRRNKRVYREPKNTRDVEKVLDAYSRDAVDRDGGGAVLFSVVGGKMSEGINFANDMARCVLVVGLPYPDITDPEMQEKMKSLDKEFKENDGSGISGQSYYHNLCMRAVNQSIGRAIRHAHDYAAVILADARYSNDPRIWRALPKWLRGDDAFQQDQGQGFGNVMSGLRNFFDNRRG